MPIERQLCRPPAPSPHHLTLHVYEFDSSSYFRKGKSRNICLSVTISSSKMCSRFICIVAYVRSDSQVVKNPPADGGDTRDPGGIPGPGSAGGGNGSPLHCSCLETSMDRGAWRATVHRVTESRTRLSTPPLSRNSFFLRLSNPRAHTQATSCLSVHGGHLRRFQLSVISSGDFYLILIFK